MSQNISPEAYQEYLDSVEKFESLLRVGITTTDAPLGYTIQPSNSEPMAYEQWQEFRKQQDHPRYPEYRRDRQSWTEDAFWIIYGTGPAAGRALNLEPFPTFPEWLAVILALQEANEEII
jgi:hypothetical protein